MKPVINIDEIDVSQSPRFEPSGSAAERYMAKIGPISGRIGAQKLGYNITAVPPGKRGFPLHHHHGNEEMFFILQGTGELHFGEEHYTLRPGDVIACPPGGPQVAHQIVNTGSEELRYLAVSTKITPEVVEYPKSGKFGVRSERALTADGQPQVMFFVGREGESKEYWEGELAAAALPTMRTPFTRLSPASLRHST